MENGWRIRWRDLLKLENLGYDMNGCKETREHLIKRIEDKEVAQ